MSQTPEDRVFVGLGDSPVHLLLKYANRHGLVAGATGTGKTITLQGIAEGFSRAGVPVFVADVKGDLSGIAAPGGGNPKVEERAEKLGLGKLEYAGCPAIFWDLFGEQGHRIRTTVSEMGPLLLSRLLDLNDTQEGVLNVAFKLADDQGLLLLDLKDLRAVLQFVSDNAREIQGTYGNVSSASVGAIQRQLLVLEQQGAEAFFGEPALELADMMRCDPDGMGYVSVLAADKLMQSPRLYATFLLWLLSELFEELPEAGDLPKPKLVFFFDEAHLLFNDAPSALVEKVEQVVRLIRSKGVGVYFVSQNPLDIPETVLGQLGNRVQHALRAFTPRDQKAVRTAADTFRPNPKFSTAEVITQLAVGEALVSVLDEKGTPTVVERTLIRPPVSRVGPVQPDERAYLLGQDPVKRKYDQAVDPESAFEVLRGKADRKAAEDAEIARQLELEKEARRAAKAPQPKNEMGEIMEAMAKSVVRSAGSQIGRQLVRGLLGGLMRGR
jgi:DNA helicase HerA-like ATPase